MKKMVSAAVRILRVPVLSPKRFSKKSRQCQRFLLARVASQPFAQDGPRQPDAEGRPATVHRCMAPSENARAGKTNIVQPLVVEELALKAVVTLPILLPAST